MTTLASERPRQASPNFSQSQAFVFNFNTCRALTCQASQLGLSVIMIMIIIIIITSCIAWRMMATAAMALSKKISFKFFTMPLPLPLPLQLRYVDSCKTEISKYHKSVSIQQLRKEDRSGMFNSLKSVWCLEVRPQRYARTVCSYNYYFGSSSQFTSTSHSKMQMAVPLIKKFVHVLFQFVSMLFLWAIITVVALPSFLSTKAGLAATVFLANQAIIGKLSVEKACIGWTKSVQLEGVSLKNSDGERVFSISKVQTKASLWQIIKGSSGFGDCTIVSPFIDLKDDPQTGLSRLALAIFPSYKLLKLKSQPLRLAKKMKRIEPAKIVSLMVNVKASNGNLDIIDGHLSFPCDVATVLGNRLFVDIRIGQYALDDNEDLYQGVNKRSGFSPVHAKLWSDRTQAELIGLLNMKAKQIDLLVPVKMEMDLTPAVARLYLSRINPLLGNIMGPVVQDDDMPDVVLHIIPHNMALPAQKYKIKIEPMQVVLARGPLWDGVLSLLSKGDITKGKTDMKLQTSTFEVDLEVDEHLKCSRIDLLIADKVHLATWGQVDLINERIQMKLAIPGTTLKEILGFSKLPLDYYLQIPLMGTLDQPQIDFKQAGLNVAQLTLYQRAGPLAGHIVKELFLSEEHPPKPTDTFPWATGSKRSQGQHQPRSL